MPPSGPSAFWSSNSSIQLSRSGSGAPQAAQEDCYGEGRGGVKMMNHHHHHHTDDDVIGSLGKVLSSVNLEGEGGGVDGSIHSRGGAAGGGQHQRYGAPGTAVGSRPGSWSGLAGGPAPPAPSGLPYNFYGNDGGNNAQPPASSSHNNNGGNDHDSLQNILYDSGIYEKEEVAHHRRASTGNGVGGVHGHHHSGTRPSTPPTGNERERKPSIDIFLSQSPSKTLGEDAFRHVMHRTASNPSLVGIGGGYGHHSGEGGGGSGLKPLASTAPSSRSESPQNARGGSNGGNGSPYHLAPRPMHQHFSNNNFSSPGSAGNNGQLHSQLSSQFSSTGIQQPQQQVQQQQPQYLPVPVSQQQPQVFYMAVPAPDGKGQVLQPVQMVQMPGQPGTLMMPMAHGSAMDATQQAHQSMMLMQPVQPSGMNNMNNGMYGQDNNQLNGMSNNNQYSQYGSAMNQLNAGGYNDGMNSFQAKNNALNNNGMGDIHLGGGGQYPSSDQGSDNGGVGGAQPPAVAGALSVLYSSPQRPPLRALLGNVRRLSRDQVGCRLLQQALDEDGPSAATAILNEGLTFWAEAMVDPFGNYLFQKILERITPEERVTLVSSVSTRLVNASLNLHGTRSVQKIVEVCAVDEEEVDDDSQDEKDQEEDSNEEDTQGSATKGRRKTKKKDTAAKILTDALRPSAARLCIDSHGNHAIQRILLKLPYRYTQFIFDAVAASVEDVARHRHGCCVIQRCLDSRHSAARTHLVGRIVEKSLELMQDAYGNYVVQYVLDVCGDDEVHAICESVIGKVCLLAIQKFSSNVMEKCLERCTDRVREEYLNELNDSDRLRELMMDPFGNYVVQRALSVSTHAQAIRLVETMKPHLSSQNGGGIRNTAGGRRILGKICRRFPNFVLEGETFEDYDLNQVLARGSPHLPQGAGGGGGGGGRRNQANQFGQYGAHGNPGPSPNHRRNSRGGGRGGGGHHHQHQGQHNMIPQYQPQQQQHHVNIQPTDNMNLMQTTYGGNPYLFPHSM